MLHLVQIANNKSRRVAAVEDPRLRCLTEVESVYDLANRCLKSGRGIRETVSALAQDETLDYNQIYSGTSEWLLLAPIDVPGAPSRLMVSGTGLTHVGSAADRQAMHLADQKKSAAAPANPDEVLTDSMRIFRWGLEGGRPKAGEIGVAPEWFYKGNGDVLRGPSEPLVVPSYGEDGGEEAEVAGVYIVAEDGTPYRIGMTVGNEFSDHQFEKRNYLNLAGSKLRTCSIGPELAIDPDFHAVPGEVRILRGGKPLWSKAIATGEDNMCHSLANLEHHHFKFEGDRQPGAVHVHFYGAHSLSFGHNIALEDGDWMDVQFEGMGRALRNPIRIGPKASNRQVTIRTLA